MQKHDQRTGKLTEGVIETILTRAAGDSFVVKVNRNRQGPCLLPLQRDKYPQIPEGEATVMIEGEEYVARFVSIAVNVVRRVGEKENLLPGMLRKWFGMRGLVGLGICSV